MKISIVKGLKRIRRKRRLKQACKIRDEILNTFLPLHISLQAFFGISIDENGNWIKLNEVKYFNERYQKAFPNKNAFLLVSEAKWDFYGEIGRRLGQLDPAVYDEPYEKQPILNLIEKLFSNKEILDYKDFKNCYGKRINSIQLKRKIVEIIKDNDLRTLCSILVNIRDQGINMKLFEEGKLDEKIVNEHKKRIRDSRDVLEKFESCKRWFNKNIHTKWPRNMDERGKQPDNSYKKLIHQLKEWNKEEKKAKGVIENIESLANFLNQIIEFAEQM